MEEKVSNLFDEFSEEPAEISNTESKVNAIESIADVAVESELEITKPSKVSEVVTKQVAEHSAPNTTDNSKMWTMAVVGSVLILIASAAGMVFILLRS